MCKTLAYITVAWLFAASCQPSNEGFNARKGGIGTGALEAKRFGDDDFLCASLTENAPITNQPVNANETPSADPEDPVEITIVDEDPADFPLYLLADSVSYDGKIKALLQAKCVVCHKPGGTPPDVSTYDTAKAAGDASLKTIEDGSMPTAGALPAADQAAFKAWVTGGYLKSGSTSSGGGAPTTPAKKSSDATQDGEASGGGVCQVPAGVGGSGSSQTKPAKPSGNAQAAKPTYVGGIKALLDSKCNACHKAGGTPPDLTSYDKAKAEGPASLATIEDGSMPPAKPLADDQQALFKSWADAGFPEK